MKRCSICKEFKNINEFNKHTKRTDGLQSHCRECNRTKSKNYYKENTEEHKQTTHKRRMKYIANSQRYIWNWLSNHPCVDCGEDNIVVLEFDHGGDKEQSISKTVSRGWSISRIQKEIDKCEVRCANCHRKKTAIQFDWKVLEYNGTVV